jgi:hypothetical protein
MQLREAQFQLKCPTEDFVSNTFNNLAHRLVKKTPKSFPVIEKEKNNMLFIEQPIIQELTIT